RGNGARRQSQLAQRSDREGRLERQRAELEHLHDRGAWRQWHVHHALPEFESLDPVGHLQNSEGDEVWPVLQLERQPRRGWRHEPRASPSPWMAIGCGSRSAGCFMPAESRAGEPAADVVERVTLFCRRLREHGLPITPAESIDALRVLETIDLADRVDVHLTL